jgi:hypothetical protein
MGVNETVQELTSRRSLLVAAASAVGALIAGPLGRTSDVLAADPNDVVLGADNTAATSTKITSTGEYLPAIMGVGGPGFAGVYGVSVTHAPDDAGANDFTAGVRGDSDVWTGVLGTSVTGRGVVGEGRIGMIGNGEYVGVQASSTAGTAMFAGAGPGGTALQASGPVRFSTSGLATIRAGRVSVTVNPGVDVTGSSKVLATLQTPAGGSIAVRRVTRLTTTNRIVVYLTASARQTCSVAWFLIS